jgi:hypothetical protein
MESLTDYVIKWLSEGNEGENKSEEKEKIIVADSVSSADTSTDSAEMQTAENETIAQNTPADEEIEIYSASIAQIEKWHSYGGLGALQDLLSPYNLGYGSCSFDKAFDKFKIGYDVKDHAATFALDGSHCYKIFFDSANAAPLDSSNADKVLQKVNSLRENPAKKIEWHERRRVPCFNSSGQQF